MATTVRSSFANQGEICLCTSRIYVHESILDEFVERFVSQVKAIQVGAPDAKETTMGALVSEQHYNKVKNYMQLAVEEGGKVQCGGAESDVLTAFLESSLPEKNRKGYFPSSLR